VENFNASHEPATDAESIAVSVAAAGSAPAAGQVPDEALTPAAPAAPVEPTLKTASLSLAATKAKAVKAADQQVSERDETPANTQAAAPPAPPAEVPQDEEKSDDGDGEKDGGSGKADGLLIAAGGLLGLGLIGAAVAGGGGGGDDKEEPAPPANRVPLATADVASATEGGAIVSGSVATNDSDPDGDSLSFALSAPVAGLVLNSSGSYTFDPSTPAYNDLDTGESRTVVANYTVSDGHGGSASSTLTITIAGVNDAPVAIADSYTTNEDTALVIAATGVLANDSDADGDALTAVLVTGPAHGTLTLNANGSFTYTPTANYSGADSFTYKPNDGSADGAPVTVSLTVTPVNDAPVAVADS
jgi:VCBS repeat-containing protein